MEKTKKVFLRFILLLSALGVYIYLVTVFRDKNNELSEYGLTTKGIVQNKELNTTPEYGKYWLVYYAYSVDSILYYEKTKIYNLYQTHYKEKDTIYVLYSRLNPEISEISAHSIIKPNKMNFIQAFINLPIIGLIDILFFIVQAIIIYLVVLGFFYLVKKLSRINHKIDKT